MALEITQVKVVPTRGEKLKGYAQIVLNDAFLIADIKIIEGTRGLFLSMPSKKRKDGSYRDIAHPLNQETRAQLEEMILAKYREVAAESPAAPSGEDKGDGQGDEDDMHGYLDQPVDESGGEPAS